MNPNHISDLQYESTFKLALKLLDSLSPEEKYKILKIIEERDQNNNHIPNLKNDVVRKTAKPPLKGSKSEKILNLLSQAKTPKEVFETFNKNKGSKVYYPEIYRVAKTYFPERYGKK